MPLPTNVDDIIRYLQLQVHPNCGSYFKEIYRSDRTTVTDKENDERNLCTSIFAMHTKERPLTTFLKLKSDALHFYQAGSPTTFICIDQQGRLEKNVLGDDIANGQQLQIVVKAGYWKAMILEEGEYSLIGEAVTPGFDFRDLESGTGDKMQQLFPNLWEEIKQYTL